MAYSFEARVERHFRAEDRVPCRLFGLLECRGEQYMVRVLDISAGGMQIAINTTAYLPQSHNIEFSCDELGRVEGTIAWVKGLRIGIQLHETTKNQAAVSSYFRNYHDANSR